MARELLDPNDGENLAVRGFLLFYSGGARASVGAMRTHMTNYGFPGHWPAWVTEAHADEFLTKSAAQAWLRHLFALEEPTNG